MNKKELIFASWLLIIVCDFVARKVSVVENSSFYFGFFFGVVVFLLSVFHLIIHLLVRQTQEIYFESYTNMYYGRFVKQNYFEGFIVRTRVGPLLKAISVYKQREIFAGEEEVLRISVVVG